MAQHRSRQRASMQQGRNGLVVHRGFEQRNTTRGMTEFASPLCNHVPAHLAPRKLYCFDLRVAEDVRRTPILRLREWNGSPFAEWKPRRRRRFVAAHRLQRKCGHDERIRKIVNRQLEARTFFSLEPYVRDTDEILWRTIEREGDCPPGTHDVRELRQHVSCRGGEIGCFGDCGEKFG